MAKTTWKKFERFVAHRLGGRRYPANSGGLVDVAAARVVAQCKEVARLSLADLERLAVEIDTVGQAQVDYYTRAPMPVTGIVVVKRSGGRGKATVPLVVLTLEAWCR